MDLGLKGQFYIVLGGSRGMGFEAASLLAEEGARLAIISRTPSAIAAAAEQIHQATGAEVSPFSADASCPGEVESAIGQAIAHLGTPRGLLVTSGLTDRNGDLLTATDDDWEANFQDVTMGHVRACRAVLPAMLSAGGGQIVTTAAYSARSAKGFLFPYASQKAAVVNFTKNLAKTYGAQGIRANCVCPGAFETSRVSESIEKIMAEQGMDRAAAASHLVTEVFRMPVAMRRPGKAREAAELMAFLLSERAGYLNGAIVNIDGGTDF